MTILLGASPLAPTDEEQDRYILKVQEPVMTQKQRLKYSILISLVVLGAMFGLSYLQNIGVISEKTFQYLAIAIAVVVVVINGIMRRKVKPNF